MYYLIPLALDPDATGVALPDGVYAFASMPPTSWARRWGTTTRTAQRRLRQMSYAGKAERLHQRRTQWIWRAKI